MTELYVRRKYLDELEQRLALADRLAAAVEVECAQMAPYVMGSSGGAVTWYCGGCTAVWYDGATPYHMSRCPYIGLMSALATYRASQEQERAT